MPIRQRKLMTAKEVFIAMERQQQRSMDCDEADQLVIDTFVTIFNAGVHAAFITLNDEDIELKRETLYPIIPFGVVKKDLPW